jgi:threonine synthase
MTDGRNPLFTHLVCLECGAQGAPGLFPGACPACGSLWLDARYDYPSVAEQWVDTRPLLTRPPSLWRYAELLPVAGYDPAISLNEGFSPFIRLVQYERLYDHPHIYVKDERQSPTGSFKDRQAAVVVTALAAQGVRECALASTGNAAAAYAAYCARAGIKLWLFVTSHVPNDKMREAALYGAEVVKVSSTYDETKHIAAEFAKRRGIYFDRGARGIPGKESMKTMAFEIAEQLGLAFDPASYRWRAPDWYIQAVSGGIGPLGVWKGFTELYQMGLIDHLPKMGIVQVAGCAPMVTAHQAGSATAERVVPDTLITVLATGDPGFAYTQLHQAVQTAGGAMIAVDDGAAFDAMRRIASRGGLSVEPATAVAFAGLERMLSDGTIAPGETVVVNCSGHTSPAESHVLGDRHAAISVEMNGGSLHDGLSAAFRQIDEQVTTVLVIDDTPNDRRLIRRLLASHKKYRILEAEDGSAGLNAAREHHPDLIVADLTMPVMDGFALLELLKHDPETMAIPVVVVSAKSLTERERAFLEGKTESVWTKGDFNTRQLVDHIVDKLGDTPVAPE